MLGHALLGGKPGQFVSTRLPYKADPAPAWGGIGSAPAPSPASHQPAVLRMLRPLQGPPLRVLLQPCGQIRTRLCAAAPPGKKGRRFQSYRNPRDVDAALAAGL